MSQHASTANHDERNDQRKSHTLITDAGCVLARVHLIRVLIIIFFVTLPRITLSTLIKRKCFGKKGIGIFTVLKFQCCI